MLGYLQFRALSTDEQAAYVFAYGTYVAQRSEPGYGINLYHVGTFFCEAWVCQERADLVRLRCFTNVQSLLPYIELVRLPPL